MRTRRKQIAIIIVITICMCNLQHSQRNPIYSEAVTSDFLYNDGDLIVPIWVDLSNKNVKTTGKNLIVESPPVFSDISLAKYYSSVKFYYSIKVKDEKEQEKAKISDEKWYCNTITCHFEWGGNYSVRCWFRSIGGNGLTLAIRNCTSFSTYQIAKVNPFPPIDETSTSRYNFLPTQNDMLSYYNTIFHH